MRDFFSTTVGMQLQPFDVYHLTSLGLIVVTVVLIYLFRDKLRNWEYEKQFRYALGYFSIIWEVALHYWQAANGIWTWADSAPLSLCFISLVMGIYVMFTKSFRVFEIGYFWAIGGVASILFPDIPYGADRFRFYQYILGHLVFFVMFMYMIFVHRYHPSFQSLKQSVIYLTIICFAFILPVNLLTDANFLFLLRADGTPFEIFEGHGYAVYLAGVVTLAIAVMYLWYLPLKFFIRSPRS